MYLSIILSAEGRRRAPRLLVCRAPGRADGGGRGAAAGPVSASGTRRARDVPEVRHLFRPRTCPARSILRFLPLRAEAEPGTEVGDPPRALIWSRGVRV